ncbi:MAG: hypothetical protein OER85_20510 [Gammaproteobacteria bacterium]|nr:hypothetical protein [Gammaproteobacteria bacterium]
MNSRNLTVFVLLCTLTFQPAFAAGEDLPDIGSPADTILSKEKEMQIGRSIYKSLRDTERVVTDPEVQEYIQDVGQKLAANAQDGDFRFNFFIVNDPAINAFALPPVISAYTRVCCWPPKMKANWPVSWRTKSLTSPNDIFRAQFSRISAPAY